MCGMDKMKHYHNEEVHYKVPQKVIYDSWNEGIVIALEQEREK
jgi:hypothetical protein